MSDWNKILNNVIYSAIWLSKGQDLDIYISSLFAFWIKSKFQSSFPIIDEGEGHFLEIMA